MPVRYHGGREPGSGSSLVRAHLCVCALWNPLHMHGSAEFGEWPADA
jgi:hypothetical protein